MKENSSIYLVLLTSQKLEKHAWSYDAMYHLRESKSKLEIFLLELFCNIFGPLGLNTCLNGV